MVHQSDSIHVHIAGNKMRKLAPVMGWIRVVASFYAEMVLSWECCCCVERS
jgi:hypothetical protein